MKNRTNICLFVLLLALLLGVTPLAAQDDEYVVQEGDNLWKLAGERLGDATLWEKICVDNPFLREPGRRFKKGKIVYVMVKPGERLVGLEKLGIIPKLTPTSQLQLAQPAPIGVIREVAATPFSVWWPLLIVLIMLIAALLINRMLTRNPVTARPAMVPGGITPETAPAKFQEMAYRLQRLRTDEWYPVQAFTILNSVPGRMWGVLNVRYAGGYEIPRRLNGDAAFRALVRFPNGTEETLYMLQGCGNDLRYGRISRYLPGPEFRFEANPVTAPAPAPAPVEPVAVALSQPAPTRTQTAVPVEQVVPQEPAVVANIQPNGEFVRKKDAPAAVANDSSIRLEIRKATDTQPAMVRITGIDENKDNTVEIKPGEVTFRYHVPLAKN